MITTLWNKFHIFMKSGRLNKVIKLSGLKELYTQILKDNY